MNDRLKNNGGKYSREMRKNHVERGERRDKIVEKKTEENREGKITFFTVLKCSRLEPISSPAFHLFASAEMNQEARAWNDNTIFQTLRTAWRNNVIIFGDRLGADSAAFRRINADDFPLYLIPTFLWLGGFDWR